jgi:hypothetical protein
MNIEAEVKKVLSKHKIPRFRVVEREGFYAIETEKRLDPEIMMQLVRATGGTNWQWQPLELELKNENIKWQVQVDQALKFDQGKPLMGLISSRFLRGLAQVLTFGAQKYEAHNWRKGFPLSRPYNALQRHLTDWNDGKDRDEESGLPLLYHAACELMFLCELAETNPLFDDRFKGNADKATPKPAQTAFPIPNTPFQKCEGEWIHAAVDGKEVVAFVPKNVEGDLPTEIYLQGTGSA